MKIKNSEIDFFFSSLSKQSVQFQSDQEILDWLYHRRSQIDVNIELIPFQKMKQWHFNPVNGNLEHDSGKFFQIIGIDVKTNWGIKHHWQQPIINQPEIGILGILTKKINGVLHFLMQAKIEPGNINYVQLSPTLQATKSNYTQVHKGKSPAYLEHFIQRNGNTKVLLDQLQSEQGGRFFKKRNRNIIIEVNDEVEVLDDFCWLTLGQIKSLLRYDNVINMDTRTVISGISYGTCYSNEIDWLKMFIYSNDEQKNAQKYQWLQSALYEKYAKHSFDEIITWVTNLKSKYDLEVEKIPLRNVEGWTIDEDKIYNNEHKYFSVVAGKISIANREVVSWMQPLVKSEQEGIIAFIVKPINNSIHFLVQAKIESGNFDVLEMAPTVQCLTGNYRKGKNEYDVPYLDYVLHAQDEQIIFKSMQSEEGGRFYKEQNLNMIVLAPNDFPEELDENYCWISLNQLQTFIKFNNYLNIQARGLLAAVSFN